MRRFSTVEELKAAVGEHLGYSSWWEITQERIDLFTKATDDYQWIHIDQEKAAQGPFGTTIAQGYLTLSLAVPLTREIFTVEGVRMAVNYGTNRVRFPAPVPSGSKLRCGAVLASVEDVEGGVQLALDLTFEIEGGSKPVCVAQTLSRLYF
ncbi:MAG: MaoC family dehydratase [Acidimicrobiia bacterium]|nr:MAG: MaoC family dehydratase [Acidimicrobiia bacterium]